MQAEPKELGILFRGDMVRAILANLDPDPAVRAIGKIETRRGFWLPKGVTQAEVDAVLSVLDKHGARDTMFMDRRILPCRYGPIGRRLWVRETWRPWIRAWSSHVQYAADGWRGPSLGSDESDAAMKVADKNGGHFDDGRFQNPAEVRWRPSILMPRWASRIDLRVTSIRAERLTEIDAAGVRREGFVHAGLGDTPEDYCRGYREINGLTADADPWVWVIGFSVEVPRG